MISNRIIKFNRHKSCLLVSRNASTTPDTKSIQPPNPRRISSDMVGPPDPVSNLRKVIFRIPPNETELERKYRELRTEVQEWNQKFWEKHNSRFYQVTYHIRSMARPIVRVFLYRLTYSSYVFIII